MDKTACPPSFNEIDFTKGFSSWHVKWLVGDYSKERVSKTFALTNNEKFDLSLSDPTELSDTMMRVSLFRFGDSINSFFCRFAVCYDGECPVFGKPYLVWKEICADEVIVLPPTLKRNAKLAVHCWIDILNTVLNEIGNQVTKRKYCGEDNQELPINITNFFAAGEGMFKGVTGEDKIGQAFSDVTLFPKKACDTDERRFFCHRNVLASRSSVFLRMFAEKAWKEEDRMVEIEDIDAETLEIVLYHVYTGKFMAAEPVFLLSIVYAADKYQLHVLKDWAVYQLIIGDFTDADRADQLLLAERHNLSQLKAVCIAMLSSCVRWSKKKEVYNKLSEDLWSDVVDAMEKRQLQTTEITVSTAY